MSTTVPAADVIDSVNNPRQPFGLPLGTVRAFLSLLICGFFWVVMLWPDANTAPRPLLAHYFMLMLVFLAFSPYSKGAAVEDESSRWLPRLLRFLAVAGTVGVVGLALAQNHMQLKDRITPDPQEVKDWWVPFLATTAGAYAAGLTVRFLLGRENPVFQSLRAWLSVAGMLLLFGEIVFWVAVANAQEKPDIHILQGFNLAFIAAYFGTRA